MLAQPDCDSNQQNSHRQNGLPVLVAHVVTGADILLKKLHDPYDIQILLDFTREDECHLVNGTVTKVVANELLRAEIGQVHLQVVTTHSVEWIDITR